MANSINKEELNSTSLDKLKEENTLFVMSDEGLAAVILSPAEYLRLKNVEEDLKDVLTKIASDF